MHEREALFNLLIEEILSRKNFFETKKEKVFGKS